mmetsp:Transcript_38369/g.49492  ORF Transcript_38369/g.49492 Transcript_38369/m.49492 type:complete len:518 (-) Transcript_38369:156-1709(-)
MGANATKIVVVSLGLTIAFLIFSDFTPVDQANPGGQLVEQPMLERKAEMPDLSAYYKTIKQAQSVLEERSNRKERQVDVEQKYQPEVEQRPESFEREDGKLGALRGLEKDFLEEREQEVFAITPVQGSKKTDETLRDVVAGMAMDIPPENLATFVGSFREFNTKAEIVLFMNSPLSKLHKKICTSHDVTIVEFNPQELEPKVLRKYHPSTYRWPLLKIFFEEKIKDAPDGEPPYRSVMMADIRDTAFQTDVFKEFDPSTPAFYAFHDYPKSQVTLGKCGWNGGWVEDCFGKEMRQQLYDNQIYCSGISMGTFNEVWTYLQIMDEIIMADEFHLCERNGVDQGIHNVLVNLDRIPGLKTISQDDGWVGNLQAKTCQLKSNKFYNKKGGLLSVAHQYDRRKPVIPYYERRYSFWKANFQGVAPLGAGADPVALPVDAAQGQGSCSKYKLGTDLDWFMGICDLRMESGSGPEECCYKCNKEEECQGFTHHKKLCYLKSCKSITDSTTKAKNGATSGYKAS